MEETINGFVCTGGWMDVVEHGERITSALLELGADEEYEDPLCRWESWRPKADERLTKDVNQKTADEASVTEGPGERAGRSPDEDLRSAGKRFSESVESAEKGEPTEAFEKWCDSVGYTARAADSSWRKALRRVEHFLYKHVMTTVSPYYFDTALVQANITRTSRRKPKRYRFEVNISDDNLQDEMRERLREYEDEIDRWHVATKKSVDSVADVEGHNVTPNEMDEDQSVKPERNIGRDDLDVPK